MPHLPNPRQERFARLFLKTGVLSRAYLQAGYKPETRNSLDSAASRLSRSAKVSARIEELRQMTLAKHMVTVETLLGDLAGDRRMARELGQMAAANQATALMAKLAGHLVERKEVGAPGSFEGLDTADAVMQRVANEIGPEAAEAVKEAFARVRSPPQNFEAAAAEQERDQVAMPELVSKTLN